MLSVMIANIIFANTDLVDVSKLLNNLFFGNSHNFEACYLRIIFIKT